MNSRKPTLGQSLGKSLIFYFQDTDTWQWSWLEVSAPVRIFLQTKYLQKIFGSPQIFSYVAVFLIFVITIDIWHTLVSQVYQKAQKFEKKTVQINIIENWAPIYT